VDHSPQPRLTSQESPPGDAVSAIGDELLVFIVESLPGTTREGGTSGARLFRDVYERRSELRQPCPHAAHPLCAATRQEFLHFLDLVRQEVERRPGSVLLQLEAHGAEDLSGLVMTSGEVLGWGALGAALTGINIASRHRLWLFGALCFGGFSFKAVNFLDRAPFFAWIGPQRLVAEPVLELAGVTFHEEFLRSEGDANRAFAEMEAAIARQAAFGDDRVAMPPPAFILRSSHWLYDEMARQSQGMIGSRSKRQRSADRILTHGRTAGHVDDSNVSMQRRRAREWQAHQPAVLRGPQRDRFLMIDLFPELRERYA